MKELRKHYVSLTISKLENMSFVYLVMFQNTSQKLLVRLYDEISEKMMEDLYEFGTRF